MGTHNNLNSSFSQFFKNLFTLADRLEPVSIRTFTGNPERSLEMLA